jgi:hypothetical protein
MPNYPSVMSYLYQTRGLTDSTGAEQIDYSNGLLQPLTESSVSKSNPIGSSAYRIRYYGPVGPNNSPDQAATVHCDGTPIIDGALMVRSEAQDLSTPDWSNGKSGLGTNFPLDVNFDGVGAETLTDQPDWASLNLAQIGGRTNFGALSTGDFATDAGDFATDAGSLATDAGDFATDAGNPANAGDYATDAGDFATDAGSFATDAGDEDYDTHQKSTVDPIPSSKQCTGCGLKAVSELNDVKLSWVPPDTGGNITYNIYRCAGVGCTPPVYPPFYSRWAPPIPTAPTFTDTVNDSVDAGATCPVDKTCYNTFYTYSVSVQSAEGPESSHSDPTAPGNEVTHLFVIADNQTVVYGSPNPKPTFQISGDINGALLTSQVTCSYPAIPPRNVGIYPITCTGPATVTTTNGVTYNQQYLVYVPGTLTINKLPVIVTAAADTKTYDATTTSSLTPGNTALAYNDSPAFTQAFDSRNAGSRTLIPTGKVNDQNGGNNYSYTYNNTPGTIRQAPLTITAKTYTKTYDATTSAALTPSISGLQVTDTVTGLAETYDTPNAGTGKRLSVSAYTVNDQNGGNNYVVTPVPDLTGVINKANATIAIVPYGLTYDGNPHTAGGTARGVLNETLAGLDLSGTTHTNAGDYASDPWVFTDTTGNYFNANGTTHDSIAKATATIAVVPYSVAFDGNPHAATGTVHTLAADYPNDPWTFTDPNGNYNSANGTVHDSISTNSIDLTGLVRQGNASIVNSPGPILRLTDATSETSAAWFGTKKAVSSGFSTSFTFRITPTNGQLADGFAFVIQNATTGTGTLGTTGLGGYLGYLGIADSIAIEFDTFQNSDYGDPSYTHVGIQSNGTGPNSSNHNEGIIHTTPVAATFADGASHVATITYDGTTLKVFLDNNPTPVATVPVTLSTLLTLDNGAAYVGFTGATGASSENADILSWTWN